MMYPSGIIIHVYNKLIVVLNFSFFLDPEAVCWCALFSGHSMLVQVAYSGDKETTPLPSAASMLCNPEPWLLHRQTDSAGWAGLLDAKAAPVGKGLSCTYTPAPQRVKGLTYVHLIHSTVTMCQCVVHNLLR